MQLVLAIIITLSYTQPSWAFETLNYDCSAQTLGDTEAALNSETNRRINKTVRRQKTCDVRKLLSELRAEIADPWTDNLETWADEAPLHRCVIPASLSVYQDFTTTDSPIGIAAGLKSVINVAGVYIGTDKLSHFMTEGYEYFVAARDGATTRNLLERGMREENGIYGILTTGIRSYADMSANFQGYKFWSEVIDGPNPYIQCLGGEWSISREFKWRDYVDSSLDESINCNEYKTVKMEQKVDRRTLPLTCPFKPLECHKLTSDRTEGVEFLLSPRCRSIF